MSNEFVAFLSRQAKKMQEDNRLPTPLREAWLEVVSGLLAVQIVTLKQKLK